MKNSLYDHCTKHFYTTLYHSPFTLRETKRFLSVVIHSTLLFNSNTIRHLQSFCLKPMYSVQLLEHLLVLTALAVL